MLLFLIIGKGRAALRSVSKRYAEAGERLRLAMQRSQPLCLWTALTQRALFWNPWCGTRQVRKEGCIAEAHFAQAAALAPSADLWRASKPRCHVTAWNWHGASSAEILFSVRSATDDCWETELAWFYKFDGRVSDPARAA